MTDTTPAPVPAVPAAPTVSLEFGLVRDSIMAAIHGDLTPLNIAVAVTAGMNLLNGKKKLSGPEKKQLLLQVLDSIFIEQGMDEAERAQLNYIIPSLIDQFHSVAKGGKQCCIVL